jgi:hypothetical protein
VEKVLANLEPDPLAQRVKAYLSPRALRFSLGRLVLEYVPMFGQNAVPDPHYIGGHPCCCSSVTRKAAVDDDTVALRQNEAVLIARLCACANAY